LRRFAQVADATRLAPAARERALERAEVLVVRTRSRVDRQLLARAPRVRLVARSGSGLDNIDLKALRARSITAIHTAGANAEAAADLTLWLALALLRRFHHAAGEMAGGRWIRGRHRGTELLGRTVLLIGLGWVGKAVARRLHACGARVLACDPYLAEDEFRLALVEPVGLDPGLARAEIVSLHCPLTMETRGLIGAARLRRIRPGGLLINTARGAIVDQAALLRALDRGRLAGAGLDVFAREPETGPLARHPRVIATPHLGGRARQAVERCDRWLVDRIEHWWRDHGR
jgi:D-3-phosphoglycerate dehydrogenase